MTDQILAGATKQQKRSRYKQARANVDSAVDDLSERSGAMMNAAQEAAATIEETSKTLSCSGRLRPSGLHWASAF